MPLGTDEDRKEAALDFDQDLNLQLDLRPEVACRDDNERRRRVVLRQATLPST